MTDRLLTKEEIKTTGLPVLKEMAESHRLLGKQFIDNKISYEKYKSLSNKLANENELFYERAITKAQDIKSIREYKKELVERVKGLVKQLEHRTWESGDTFITAHCYPDCPKCVGQAILKLIEEG